MRWIQYCESTWGSSHTSFGCQFVYIQTKSENFTEVRELVISGVYPPISSLSFMRDWLISIDWIVQKINYSNSFRKNNTSSSCGPFLQISLKGQCSPILNGRGSGQWLKILIFLSYSIYCCFINIRGQQFSRIKWQF